jgi:hypothetical protein
VAQETSDQAPALDAPAEEPPAEEAPAEEEPTAEEEASMQFVFSDSDPIRFQIEDGSVSLVLRTGLRRQGKEDIPTQLITVPLTYRAEGNSLVIERGPVQVVALDHSQADFAQAGVLRKRVQSAFPSRNRERRVELEREGHQPFAMNIQDVKALNGWVAIWLN